MAKRDLAALSVSELQEELRKNARRYRRLVIPQMVSFFGLMGIGFGLRAAFGIVPALVAIGLALVAFTGWFVPMVPLMFSRNRLRFELARRSRQSRQ